MFPPLLREQATALLHRLEAKGWMVSVAESCTGGLLSALLTEIPGSSRSFERGFVTYSNEAKTDMLGVDMALINTHGAVSTEVAQAMVMGVLTHARADVAVAITGIAGPGGGTEAKPVGLVYIAACVKDAEPVCVQHVFEGDRTEVRLQSAEEALNLLFLSLWER